MFTAVRLVQLEREKTVDGMFMVQRRGGVGCVCWELYSARDWYDHLESEVGPCFQGGRRVLNSCTCIHATICEAE